MPASRNAQSDGNAFALCGGRTWGTATTEACNDDDFESGGFARGSGTSRPIASVQATRVEATIVSNCSIIFRIKGKFVHVYGILVAGRNITNEHCPRFHRPTSTTNAAPQCHCSESDGLDATLEYALPHGARCSIHAGAVARYRSPYAGQRRSVPLVCGVWSTGWVAELLHADVTTVP